MSTENNIYTSFKDIFLEYYSSLCTYAFRYTKDTSAAEDIVQDVFTSFWNKREEINFEQPIKPLLYKYTQNRALDYLKSSSYKTERLDEYTSFAVLDSYIRDLIANQSEEYLDFKELNKEIMECIDSLPDQCKRVYNLSRSENLKNREIAEELNINIKTVEKHISKALFEIRTHLDKKGLLPILALAVLCLKFN